MLAPKSSNRSKPKTDVQLLSPKLCANLLRKSIVMPGMIKHNCTAKELTFLQEFLSRNSNFKSCHDLDVKKCLHKRTVWENEIVRAVHKTYSDPGKVVLTKAANRHLITILNTSNNDLYFKFRHKKLLTHVILPQLDRLRGSNSKSVLRYFKVIPEIYRPIFHHKLVAKDLRRTPKGLQSEKGASIYFHTCRFTY